MPAITQRGTNLTDLAQPDRVQPGPTFPASRGITRRAALLLPVLLAACATTPPRLHYPPLRYNYLARLGLNVGRVEVVDNWHPLGEADLSDQAPYPPDQVLAQMVRDRVIAAGTTGQGVFTIDAASIIRNGDALTGTLAGHLLIIAPDGAHVGYAEARVVRVRTGLGDSDQLPTVLYDMTKQMMNAMNVELEYQIRRRLKDWLVQAPPLSPLPQPVRTQPLAAPAGSTAAPAVGTGAAGTAGQPSPLLMPGSGTQPMPHLVPVAPPPGN